MKVVIAGGGTAGHVAPSLAVAERLRERDVVVEFIGSAQGQEATIVPRAGYPFHALGATPFRREVSLRSALAPLIALRSVRRAVPLVADAGAVLGMGGYASVGAVLAARRAGVPIVLHEQNAVPGLANRLLARIATAVAITFRSSRARFPSRTRIEATGIPLRRSVLGVRADRDAVVGEARRTLALAEGRTTVLVTGGSQGALHLNRVVVGAIPMLARREDVQLVVLTGARHEAIVTDAARTATGATVTVVPFLDRMELALAAADVAVSRAGASSVHELAACGVPSILVPYPHATGDHQVANARELERVGGAEVLLDRDLTPRRLVDTLLALVDDDRRRASMSERARSWSTPDADRRLADLVLEVAR